MTQTIKSAFDLTGRVAVITGGAGLLGKRHAAAIAEAGGIPVLLDVDAAAGEATLKELGLSNGSGMALQSDITDHEGVADNLATILDKFGRVDILVNNAANNPKVEDGASTSWSRLENFPLSQWNQDLAVGITGAFICSRVFGGWMSRNGGGVIVNVASDLAVIAPDQRLYRQENLSPQSQPVKPVTYSVVKTALIGLTRYLATYWAEAGVRCNALSPGGVYTSQPDEFVARISQLVPLGRMADVDEYKGAMLFLCSDASSYMTGQNLIVDGGRSCW